MPEPSVRTGPRKVLSALIDRISGIGLFVSVPVLIACAGYLLVAVFGGAASNAATLPPDQKANFVKVVQGAHQLMTYASIVMICSLILKFFWEDALGQALALGGAACYFGLPFAASALIEGMTVQQKWVFALLTDRLQWIGAVALVPGVLLIIRDLIIRVRNSASVERIQQKMGTQARSRTATGGVGTGFLIQKCWNMNFCRDVARQVCPAWAAKKPCWRLRSGCLCDERVITHALAAKMGDTQRAAKTETAKAPATAISQKAKAERCRRCAIYAERQRQKYRLLVPFVIPVSAVIMYFAYAHIKGAIYRLLLGVDTLASYLTSHPGQPQATTSAEWNFMIIGTTVWLGVLLTSYLFKLLDYLIYDLQV